MKMAMEERKLAGDSLRKAHLPEVKFIKIRTHHFERLCQMYTRVSDEKKEKQTRLFPMRRKTNERTQSAECKHKANRKRKRLASKRMRTKMVKASAAIFLIWLTMSKKFILRN